jgi:hypothetical protein
VHFRLYPLRFSFLAREAVHFPPGKSANLLRGAFGTILRRIAGPGTTLRSSVGIESEAIEFRSTGATFRKVGHDRVAICYALSGRGRVDDQVVEGGEAALVEQAAGIALHGQAGFRIVLVHAPRGT